MNYIWKSVIFSAIFVIALGAGGASSKMGQEKSGDTETTKILRIGHSMNIKCNIGQGEQNGAQISWYKDDKLISADDEHYGIFNDNASLTINKASKEDVGMYRCQTGDQKPSKTTNISLIYLVLKFLPKSMTVLQGDKFTLTCDVEGDPSPSIAWFKDGVSVLDAMNASRVELSANENGVEDSVLNILSSEYADRALYTCSISILDVQYNTTTQVRVKDMYAALWPLLGIIIEVVVLCLIIFIYEKQRAKKDFEESDTDQTPEQQKTVSEGQDVRCRK